MSEFERKPDGGLNAWIETYEAMGGDETDAEMLCLLLELRRRRENQAETERERDELITQLSIATERAGINFDRAKVAEDELARRDAAASEPVAWQYRYNEGKVGDWKTVDSESECNHLPCFERRPIYTAAQPAVLPGEVEELSMLIRRLVHSLKNSNPHSGLLWSVPDFMHKKGYWKANDCLRGEND